MKTRKRWQCPSCGKSYTTFIRDRDPEMCPKCETRHNRTPPLLRNTTGKVHVGDGCQWMAMLMFGFLGVCVIAALTTNTTPRRVETAPEFRSQEPEVKPNEKSEAMVRVTVWDDTVENPIHDRAEIWFHGYGSWNLKRATQYGSATKDLGRRTVDKLWEGDDSIQLYPTGRSGREVSIPLKMTEEMNPDGSMRDSVDVVFSDDSIEILGLPIKTTTGKTVVRR